MHNTYSIILGLFVLAGVFTSIWGWTIIRSAKQTLQWPKTDGHIKISEPASTLDAHLPHIVYDYTAEGQQYQSTLQLPGGTTPSPELAARYVERFPAGATIQVAYNPDQPDISTLEPGPRDGDWLIFSIGLGATVFGILFLFFSG